ncbi:hypothetical protein GCM10027176_17590 [Actinoallomurus bryophytorum]|uniref:Uncharacterized protein n=1 Tax=Actinoallomurus bryophytorum TaxID=1490222 RepID=A0A543CLV8_9ACTN|nr:hypothetical protein FB559_3561 [Actinoallomurus bryophytorum]
MLPADGFGRQVRDRERKTQGMGMRNTTQGICALYGKTPQEISDRKERRSAYAKRPRRGGGNALRSCT